MRIHEKADGLLMIRDDGCARYLTARESIMWRVKRGYSKFVAYWKAGK